MGGRPLGEEEKYDTKNALNDTLVGDIDTLIK
jgi:hypothetical protein